MAYESMDKPETGDFHTNISSAVSRNVCLLKDTERVHRRQALKSIRDECSKNAEQLSEGEFKIFANFLFKPLVQCLSDPVEKCRELAAESLFIILKQVDNVLPLLSYIIPVLVQRIGSQEIKESSEEVRLMELQTLQIIVSKCKDKIAEYMHEVSQILSRTVLDPYSEIKKESCLCICEFAVNTPHHFHLQSETIIKSLLQTITHQHAKVRVLVVHALGAAIQYGTSSLMSDVVPHLAQRLFDQSPAVRLKVAIVVGDWLIFFGDRYSFFHRLIPLMLTCTLDDVTEIREKSQELWEKAGNQYILENEKDYKEQLDFPKLPPEHYPKDTVRPCLGCRVLVRRHLHGILPPLLRDLDDWLPATRVKSINLLYSLLLHAEDHTTIHMEKVMTGLVRGACDEELEVCKMVNKSAELVGYFINMDVWIKLLLPLISEAATESNLTILAGILRGVKCEDLIPLLVTISSTLSQPDTCQHSKVSQQKQLLLCVEALLQICGSQCIEVSYNFFIILITVKACCKEDESVINKVNTELERLSNMHSFSDAQELYQLHSKALLDRLYTNHQLWTYRDYDTSIFCTFLYDSNAETARSTFDLIIPMFIANLQPEKEAELRLQLFITLSSYFLKEEHSDDCKSQLKNHIQNLITGAIIPNLVWHAGRTAAALRTTAISCLWTCIKNGFLDKETVGPIADNLFTQLISLLEDEILDTRLICSRILINMFPLLTPCIDSLKVHNIYPEFLKRMDDVNDDVRILMTKVFLSYFKSFPKDHNWIPYSAHLQEVYFGLLVHMDDPQETVQKAVLELLKDIASLNPSILFEETKRAQGKHRVSQYCDELISHLSNICIGDN